MSLSSTQGSHIVTFSPFSSKIFFNNIEGLPTVKFVSGLKHLPNIFIFLSYFSEIIKSANHSVCTSLCFIILSYQLYDKLNFLAK